ncbi:BTAD domain-containing putative transcriptional regulator [Streptomyces beijiangensis]
MGAGTPEQLRFALLGPLRAWRGAIPLDLGPDRRQAVLAALVLRADRQVSHEQLLDDIWDTRPPASGHRVLPSHVLPLRKALDIPGTSPADSVIRSGKGWYKFGSHGVRLDVAEFDELAAVAQRSMQDGDLATAISASGDALALFGGEPLARLPGLRAQAERQRLSERRLALCLERLECLLLLRRFTETMDELSALSSSHPLDESVVELRMRALYGSGRQAEALTAYQVMRRHLRDELGADPGAQLRQTYEAVLRQDGSHLLRPAPARSASGARRRRTVNDLPGHNGRLIGRDAELARLVAPSADTSVSLVTVDGTAGVGKTALVVRAAHELSAHYPDGCLYVDLYAHSTQQRQAPERVLQRLLRSLGAVEDEPPGDLDDLTAAWRAASSTLRLLLVLDDALDADQIRPLLPSGAGSRVLVAGRRRLAELDADLRITLDPLASGDGVSLLTRLVGEDRTSREPDATRRLVQLCDGLPLALRIAGSRLQSRSTWTVGHFVGRMAEDGRRLRELSVGDRTLEAALLPSYDQLTPEQQRGFRALGLTPTVEFDVLTVAAMLHRPAGETDDLLEGLVDTSLLQQPRTARYRLHDLVRVLARRLAEESPGESAEARRAALHVCLDAARTTSDWEPSGFPTGPGPDPTRFTGQLDAERWLDAVGGELVDVVGHAAAHGEADLACWIAEALCDYFVRQGRYDESRAVLETALAHADRATDGRMAAALRNCLGYTGTHQRRYRQARVWHSEALHLSRERHEPHEEARALTGLGAVAVSLGEGEQACTSLIEAVALSKRLNSSWVTSIALVTLGRAYYLGRRNDEALDCFTEAHTYADSGSGSRLRGLALSCGADVRLRLGHLAAAERDLRTAIDLGLQARDAFLCARSLTRLATVHQLRGDTGTAVGLHQHALQQHQLLSPLTEPGYNWLEMDIRSRLARTYLAAGQVQAASEQFQAVLNVPRTGPAPPPVSPRPA